MYKGEPLAAIVLAGGVGRRFGGAIAKQYVELDGKPVIMHSVLTFARMGIFDSLVVVAREEEFTKLGEMIRGLGIATRVIFAEGGATRSESSYHGLMALAGVGEGAGVLIHDAARPLVSRALVKRVVEALSVHDAVVPGVRSVDAVVEVSGDGVCRARRARESYRLVQTPQAFRLGVVREAYEEAFRGGGGSWDDDATVVARFGPGVRVACVEGEVENFKITRAEDLLRAERYLMGLRNGEGA